MDDKANSLNDMVTAAVKLDSGKPTFDLVPWDAIEEVAKLFEVGSKKYTPRNWEKGFRYGRTFAALMRHATAWFMCKVTGKSDIDEETGLSHMVAVAWNALVLIAFQLRGVGEDDRPTRPEVLAKT